MKIALPISFLQRFSGVDAFARAKAPASRTHSKRSRDDVAARKSRSVWSASGLPALSVHSVRSSGFTMVEIAIAVAVIAFALVAIIGVLPAGLQVQKENREETLISQDAVYLMDAIRSGAEGMDDLPQYVSDIETNGVKATGYSTGADIIGLLSTPGTNRAIIRAISGTVSEMGPNTADVAFKYQLEVQMRPFDPLPNLPPLQQRVLSEKLHEVRLLFRWPILGKGNIGTGRQMFRNIVSGDLLAFTNQSTIYYYLRP